MPVLTFDVGGPNQMNVECQRIGHAAPRRVGDRGYSGSGSEWSQIRDELMVVPFVTVPLPWSQIATIRSLFALAARVNCSGSGFNKPGTIVCSGELTDELDTTGDRGVISGTLFEIGSITGFTPVTSPLYLTAVVSPDDGSMNLGTSTASEDLVGGGVSLLVGVPIPGCSSGPGGSCTPVISAAPEFEWLSRETVAGGWIAGTPVVQFASSSLANGVVVSIQDAMVKLYVVRSGVDVAEWDTDWSNGNGSYAGGDITMSPPAVVFDFQPSDRIRAAVYGRMATRAGFTGGSTSEPRQSLGFGYVGAHRGIVYLPGTVTFDAP